MKKYLVVYNGKFMGGSTEVEERDAISAAKGLWKSGLCDSVYVEDEQGREVWKNGKIIVDML